MIGGMLPITDSTARCLSRYPCEPCRLSCDWFIPCLNRWVAPVGSFEPTGVAKPEEVELSRATFPATSCAVGTQVAEAATCATQRRNAHGGPNGFRNAVFDLRISSRFEGRVSLETFS